MINTLDVILKYNNISFMNEHSTISRPNAKFPRQLCYIFLFKIKSNSNKWLHVLQNICSIFKLTSWKWYINNLSQIEVNSCVKYVLIYDPQYNKFNVLLPAFFHTFLMLLSFQFILFFCYLKNCFITTSFIKLLMSDIYIFTRFYYISECI